LNLAARERGVRRAGSEALGQTEGGATMGNLAAKGRGLCRAGSRRWARLKVATM